MKDVLLDEMRDMETRLNSKLDALYRESERLRGQISVWRWIATFLGLPGVLALIAIAAAAATNQTVTGPGGLVP